MAPGGRLFRKRFAEGRGKCRGHLMVELPLRFPKPTRPHQQQTQLPLGRGTKLPLYLIALEELGQVVERGGGFQQVDAPVQHADFHRNWETIS